MIAVVVAARGQVRLHGEGALLEKRNKAVAAIPGIDQEKAGEGAGAVNDFSA